MWGGEGAKPSSDEKTNFRRNKGKTIVKEGITSLESIVKHNGEIISTRVHPHLNTQEERGIVKVKGATSRVTTLPST